LRKYIFGSAALALASGTVVVALSGGSASASTAVRNIPTVTANGSVSCGSDNGTTATSGITGTITFVPPLKNGGTSHETTSVKIKLKPCTPTGNTNLPAGGKLKGKVSQSISSPTSTNNCTGLATSAPESLVIKWTYKNTAGVALANVNPTTVNYSGYTTNSASNPPWAGSSNNAGFQLPGSGGTATGTGSFATGGGAASVAEAYLSHTAAQIAVLCAGTNGYASDTFVFGQTHVGP
jgi:hypothetical protein